MKNVHGQKFVTFELHCTQWLRKRFGKGRNVWPNMVVAQQFLVILILSFRSCKIPTHIGRLPCGQNDTTVLITLTIKWYNT